MLKQVVSLKGVKDGYQLRVEAESSFSTVLEQLESLLKKMNEEQKDEPEKEKNEKTDKKEQKAKKDIPLVVKTGNRLFTEEEKEKMLAIINLYSQFKVQDFEAQVAAIDKVYEWYEQNSMQLKMENVRSGQVLDAPGDVLLVGNVQPGGVIRAVGSVFVIGDLRGIIHAGVEGDEQAVVVAHYRNSSQIRIADAVQVIEEKEEIDTDYEVAFLNDTHEVEFQPIEKLRKLRPELGELTGRLQ